MWVKYHFKTETGIANLTSAEAAAVAARDPDHATRELSRHISEGGIAASREIQLRQVCHFARADAEYGARVARGLGLAEQR